MLTYCLRYIHEQRLSMDSSMNRNMFTHGLNSKTKQCLTMDASIKYIY